MKSLILAGSVLLCGACGSGGGAPAAAPSPSPAPTIDQAKFEALYRSAKAIEGAVGSGVSLMTFSELLQTLSTEIGIAQDKATKPEEAAMIGQFSNALTLLVGSREMWREVDAEAAQRVWTYAIPQLRAGVRLYLSDAAGAKTAISEAEMAEKARAAELAARQVEAKAGEERVRAEQAKQTEAWKAAQERMRKMELLAGSLIDSNAEVRLSACNELQTLGTAASMYNGNIRDRAENDSDPRVRAACAKL